MQYTTNIEQVVAALRANNNEAIDDHLSYLPEVKDRLRHIHGVACFGDRVVALCSAEETPYFSLNLMVIDDNGIAHLSRHAVGGAIESRRHGSLEKAIEAYNEPSQYAAAASWYTHTPVTGVVYL